MESNTGNQPQTYYYYNDGYPNHNGYQAPDQYNMPQEYTPQGYISQDYMPQQHMPQEHISAQSFSSQGIPLQDASASKAHLVSEQTETEWEQSSITPGQPLSRASWFDRLNHGWTPEIFSEALSLAFLLALVILLFELDGRPLSTWTIAVSPNAVIAVLSIASKASLIYALGQSISQLKWLHLSQKPDRWATPAPPPAL